MAVDPQTKELLKEIETTVALLAPEKLAEEMRPHVMAMIEEHALRNAPRPAVGDELPMGGGGETWGALLAGRARTAPLNPSGSLDVPTIVRTIGATSEQPRRLLQVIPRSDEFKNAALYMFLQEVTRTHAAAPVEQEAVKPASTYELELVGRPYSTIAHITGPIHRDILADVPRLQEYIDRALRAGLELAIEDQIVNGDGTGAELTGLLEEDGIETQTFETDVLTTTRKALTTLQGNEIGRGIYVFSPDDWEALELLQASDETGAFYWGGPIETGTRRLWGQEVIVSSALAEGTGLLVDFQGSTMIWERESARVDWSENVFDSTYGGNGGASDFERNLIRFRGETRIGFGILRPSGVVSIALSNGG